MSSDWLTRTPIERFNSKWVLDGDCWFWAGSKGPEGYGRFYFDGVPVLAHRWSYTYHIGVIPDGLHLDHLCRNRACVFPYHLEPVTCAENLRRSPLSNGNRTHCPSGHEYDEFNTRHYIKAAGPVRVCITCEGITSKQSYQRRLARLKCAGD